MKFTKQQLLDALKEKLTENGKHLSISEKTIKSLSDSHYELLVNEETTLDDLVGKILPQYVSLNGNYEKDNADFIKKWKETHPDNNTKKAEPKDPETKPTSLSPELQALMDKVKALEEKDAKYEAARLVSQKRSELMSRFKEEGIKDAKWTEKYMSKLAVTVDTDIEKETADALDFYNLAHAKGGNYTPGNAGSALENEKINADRWKGVNKIINASN